MNRGLAMKTLRAALATSIFVIAGLVLAAVLAVGLARIYNRTGNPFVVTLMLYLPSTTTLLFIAISLIYYSSWRCGRGISVASALRSALHSCRAVVVSAVAGLALALPSLFSYSSLAAAAWSAGTLYASLVYAIAVLYAFFYSIPRRAVEAAGKGLTGVRLISAWLLSLLAAGVVTLPLAAFARSSQKVLVSGTLVPIVTRLMLLYTPSPLGIVVVVVWVLAASEALLLLVRIMQREKR